jgi:predicted metal-binding protein
MLVEAPEGVTLVVCSTCRFSVEEKADETGVRGGALLLAAVQKLAQDDPRLAPVTVTSMPCFFNCDQHCTVHLRAPGKMSYVLGKFEPTDEAAQAILDYAVLYAASAQGIVPFRQWPQGVKGHFIVRTPPPNLLFVENPPAT